MLSLPFLKSVSITPVTKGHAEIERLHLRLGEPRDIVIAPLSPGLFWEERVSRFLVTAVAALFLRPQDSVPRFTMHYSSLSIVLQN